ncbi:hypothetical protein ACFUVV_25165 [Streptomyces sp. NPDC057376]|uniref:hypothetical protein n=1 Tax=unclassified Streptomyces TaxID=2593676 RepID=UPI0011610124|nr:hypothetical protein [Streptomyces sp. CB02414]
MRTFLSGAEIPPGDVVTSLLYDAEQVGGPVLGILGEAWTLHREALNEHDLRSGRRALVMRLNLEEAQQKATRERLDVLIARGQDSGVPDHVMWTARDLHQRAAARCAELRRRLDGLDSAEVTVEAKTPVTSPGLAPVAGGTAARTARRSRSEMIGGFLGAALAPESQTMSAPSPRTAEEENPSGIPAEDTAAVAASWREAHQIAWQLAKLRAEGSGGAAHVLLSETVAGPPRRLPCLAQALENTGQDADVPILLWETASLPPEQLAVALVAFTEAAREDDIMMLLRHASARPPEDITALLHSLVTVGHVPQARRLLRDIIRTGHQRTVVDLAHADRSVIALLLQAAADVSDGQRAQLDYALRSERLLDT